METSEIKRRFRAKVRRRFAEIAVRTPETGSDELSQTEATLSSCSGCGSPEGDSDATMNVGGFDNNER